MKTKALPSGWFSTTKEEAKSLFNELQRELPPGHLLYGKKVCIVAHKNGATDDVLCQHLDEVDLFTVVHLTWSMRQEINEFHPAVEMVGSFQDFLAYETELEKIRSAGE